MIFKKYSYGNGRLAIMALSELGERLAMVTVNVEDITLGIFGPNAMLLSEECSDDIVNYLTENGYIEVDGTTFPVGGTTYRLAIANQEWVDSLEKG